MNTLKTKQGIFASLDFTGNTIVKIERGLVGRWRLIRDWSYVLTFRKVSWRHHDRHPLEPWQNNQIRKADDYMRSGGTLRSWKQWNRGSWINGDVNKIELSPKLIWGLVIEIIQSTIFFPFLFPCHKRFWKSRNNMIGGRGGLFQNRQRKWSWLRPPTHLIWHQ